MLINRFIQALAAEFCANVVGILTVSCKCSVSNLSKRVAIFSKKSGICIKLALHLSEALLVRLLCICLPSASQRLICSFKGFDCVVVINADLLYLLSDAQCLTFVHCQFVCHLFILLKVLKFSCQTSNEFKGVLLQ